MGRSFRWTPVVLGVLGFAYVRFALHRCSDIVFMNDPRWPRDWPYPDPWLAALERRLDADRPVPFGSIKLRGEFPIIRWRLWFLLRAFLLLIVAGLAPDLARFARRIRDRRTWTPDSNSGEMGNERTDGPRQ